jgi:disulfide bond formation protein DsbB
VSVVLASGWSDPEVASPFFATLALACWAGLFAGGVVAVLARRSDPEGGLVRAWDDVRAWALPLAGAIAVVATLGSLYYSEVADFVPCRLCWYQRIAMYPLALILAVATFRRDPGVRWYALPLCAAGILISAYHSWIQAFPPDSGTSFCTTDAPCTTRHVWEFGFVSIPFMAFTGFVTIAALLLVANRREPSGPAGAAPLERGAFA